MTNVINAAGYFKYASLNAMRDKELCDLRLDLSRGESHQWRNFLYLPKDLWAVDEAIEERMLKELAR